MATQQTVAEFVATLKLIPDQSSIVKSQRFLKKIETDVATSKRKFLRDGGLFGSMFSINKPALERKVQGSLNSISTTASFHLNRFTVNQSALSAAVNRAIGTAQVNVRPVNINTRNTGGARVNGVSNPRSSARNVAGGISTAQTILGAGIGGFGIGRLNRTMQELELLPVSMGAVTNSPEEAQRQLAFLRSLGKEVGATQRELAPEYTKFFSSAEGTALEPYAQSGFRSFTRYGKVMGLDQESMKGSFKAITQMVNKQQIMAEELKGQLAERLPAAIKLMAQAATGGDTKKLIAMMAAGQLDPNIYLPKFFEQLEIKAAGGWGAYTQTTRYQQNQSSVGFENLLMTFGKAGGNDAFFRGWKAIADTLPKLDPLAKSLAVGFQGIATGVEGAGRVLVGFSDTLEWISELSPLAQTGIEGLGVAFAMFGTKVGRSLLPITALFLLLDDLATYNQGGDSVTGRALNGEGGALAAIAGIGGALAIGAGIDGIGGKKGRPVGGVTSSLKNIGKYGVIGAGAMGLASGLEKFDEMGQVLRDEDEERKRRKYESMYEMMNASQNSQSQLYGNTFEILNLNITAPNSDPEEHANLFMKRIEETMVNFPNSE